MRKVNAIKRHNNGCIETVTALETYTCISTYLQGGGGLDDHDHFKTPLCRALCKALFKYSCNNNVQI